MVRDLLLGERVLDEEEDVGVPHILSSEENEDLEFDRDGCDCDSDPVHKNYHFYTPYGSVGSCDGFEDEEDDDEDLTYPVGDDCCVNLQYTYDDDGGDDEENEYSDEEDNTGRCFVFDFDTGEEVEEDIVEPPFWYGHEEMKQVEQIIEQYHKALVRKEAFGCRSMRAFVGRVKRTRIPAQVFQTYDIVTLYNNQRMKPGEPMPEVTVHFVLTLWDADDGIPSKITTLTECQKSFWMDQSQTIHDAPSYLYCKPNFFTGESMFSFFSSCEESDVSYAHIPWDETPFHSVTSEYIKSNGSEEDEICVLKENLPEELQSEWLYLS